MALLIDWLLGRSKAEDKVNRDFLDNEASQNNADTAKIMIAFQKIAYLSCVRLIGATTAAVEWEIYSKGKRKYDREHWAWNYSPNPNQTAAEFMTELVAQLYEHQEAVAVALPSGYRYVAENYSVERALTGDIYQNITAYNGQPVPGVFSANDVLVIRANSIPDMSSLLGLISSEEGKLVTSAIDSYQRDHGQKGILNVDAVAEADPDFEETYSDLVGKSFKKFYNSPNAVLPLFDGYSYEDLSNTAASGNSRDIRAMLDDVMEITAAAFGIPASIALGKQATKDEFNIYMTNVVKPLVNAITEEINRKLYSRENVQHGSKIVPSFANVRYKDLFDVADPIDKLIGSGAYCVNDIRIRNGDSIIDEDWAWQHWMTKNYAPAGDLVDGVQDGQPISDPKQDPDRPDTDSKKGGDEE